MPLLTPQFDFRRIQEIPTSFFAQHGIRALLLDVDNTLTGDNSQEVKPEVAEWLARQPGMEDFTASRKTAFQIKIKGNDDDDDGEETTTTVKGGGRSISKNRSIKYVCPKCGAIIRATKQVNVVCGDCDVPFERA